MQRPPQLQLPQSPQQVEGQSCKWRKAKCHVVFWWSWMVTLASTLTCYLLERTTGWGVSIES